MNPNLIDKICGHCIEPATQMTIEETEHGPEVVYYCDPCYDAIIGEFEERLRERIRSLGIEAAEKHREALDLLEKHDREGG